MLKMRCIPWDDRGCTMFSTRASTMTTVGSLITYTVGAPRSLYVMRDYTLSDELFSVRRKSGAGLRLYVMKNIRSEALHHETSDCMCPLARLPMGCVSSPTAPRGQGAPHDDHSPVLYDRKDEEKARPLVTHVPSRAKSLKMLVHVTNENKGCHLPLLFCRLPGGRGKQHDRHSAFEDR